VKKTKVIIMGAAGRDFHNFNVFFRNNPDFEVVAFTAAQIPDIAGRKYPRKLAGKLYPVGIPIYPEKDLPKLIVDKHVDEVILAYSDLPHQTVMEKASLVLSSGANFQLLGSHTTMLKSDKPVISVCAVRTGAGKSQTSRKVCKILKGWGHKVVVVRHPMPYGILENSVSQRFETVSDLKTHNVTIEEGEEYQQYIDRGIVVYGGVDFAEILEAAEKEADIIVWEGGNNDIPFYKPDLHIVVADALRPGHEVGYYPGEVNLMMADVMIINKVASARPEDVEKVRTNIRKYNPEATIIDAASAIFIKEPEKIKGKKVLVIEDGPTLTHGEMGYGAGTLAAQRAGAEIVDPRPFAVGSIKKIFDDYPHIKNVLPAMGYSGAQKKELEDTINKVECDIVVVGTPINLANIIKISKPIVRVVYELQEIGKPDLETVLKKFENES